MDYRKVVDFKYDGQLYSMFIDNKSRYYFLEIDKDGNYQYVDINKFLELGKLFSNPPHIFRAQMDKNKKSVKMVPKILIGGVATVVTLGTLLLAPGAIEDINYRNNYKYQEQTNNQQPYYQDEGSQINISYDDETNKKEEIVEEEKKEESVVEPEIQKSEIDKIKEKQKEFIVDTYTPLDIINTYYVYDMDYLDNVLESKTLTIDDFNKIIDRNSGISSKYKDLVKQYCKDYIEKAPNAERRVLYENLKTIKFYEVDDKLEMAFACMSNDAVACYLRNINQIYVMKDNKYEKGTWDYQVLYHELSHAARTAMWVRGEKEIKIQCEGLNFYTITSAEALNSLFAINLFDYEEKDIAYQLQSNYFKIMVDSMDNYEITDYMNHSLGYFAQKLDEFHGDEDYAAVLLKLIETQYNDFHNDRIEIEQKEFYPIYEYISDIYYKNKINKNMSYDSAVGITDELIEKIMYDVPEKYNIDTAYFYEYLNEYLTTHYPNIKIGSTHARR